MTKLLLSVPREIQKNANNINIWIDFPWALWTKIIKQIRIENNWESINKSRHDYIDCMKYQGRVYLEMKVEKNLRQSTIGLGSTWKLH